MLDNDICTCIKSTGRYDSHIGAGGIQEYYVHVHIAWSPYHLSDTMYRCVCLTLKYLQCLFGHMWEIFA